MDELVKLVVQKTGIPEPAARQAVEVVLGFLKEKLPAPIADQIDAVVSGSGKLDDVTKGLKNFLKNS
ncbi:hypothetical protein BECAL_00365 [Bellilinea caldifistulae]|uniref:DUF2267 domain-containing protein n=1 Tax=Bellilinea caldifistulae TaxID=360411 RepID=A0A0P6XCZ1_9CHLR|nr:hypothetical protein [Bellilinea caldifistulae]KPL78129.1 hypothetical protein AC812_01510 [Bellilinea caldifistulae]GAP09225.1 hypothetical protein BECAL_00365 [Bellilinea caldifistulae]